ncbi:hypothetical protein BH24ACT6_BH24ACT6_02320 [soil metagenome]
MNENRNDHRSSAEHDGTVLLIGGAGKTGRRVAERLDGLDIPFRLGSRSSDVRFDSPSTVLEAADRAIPRSRASSSRFAGQPRAAIAAS